MGIKTGLLDGVLADYVNIVVGCDLSRGTSNEITRKITCDKCGFIVNRFEVRGQSNKYWGMKSKIVAHFHHAHPEIWAKLERD